jgi:hypothetical protein
MDFAAGGFAARRPPRFPLSSHCFAVEERGNEGARRADRPLLIRGADYRNDPALALDLNGAKGHLAPGQKEPFLKQWNERLQQNQQ